MYIGAGLALGGASLFYQSLPLLGYAAGFFLVTHLFVVLYEEPTLRHTFGTDYESYCRAGQALVAASIRRLGGVPLPSNQPLHLPAVGYSRPNCLCPCASW